MYSNFKFFDLISFTEHCFAKHVTSVHVFDFVMEEVFSSYKFTFPCLEHASEILSYALYYYIRLRMRQYTLQLHQTSRKEFVSLKKQAKLKKT